MTGYAARTRGRRLPSLRWAAAAAAIACGALAAQPAATPAAPVVNSNLDAPLFYQLLIGEIELNAGRAGNAYEVMLDAARRQGDEALYQRAVEIALQARAGEQALAAAVAWRNGHPNAVPPLRFQTQILLALNRVEAVVDPLQAWLALAPTMERPSLLAGLPRLLERQGDKSKVLAVVEKLVLPYLDDPGTRTAARVALGQAHRMAGNNEQALGLARAARSDDAPAPGPVLLALDLLPGTPAAEVLVTDYLARADAETGVRLAYVRQLTQSQRYADASRQLEQVTREKPRLAEPWLTLGALQLELKAPKEAEASLLRYVELASQTATPPVAAASVSAASATDDDDDDAAEAPGGTGRDLTQAWLLLARAAELRGDLKGAETWLAKVDNPQRALEVQSRRAALLAGQGRIKEARALIQAVPERTGDDGRAKAMAEAQMLRDVKRWREAAEMLAAASQRFADDTDLLYERAMVEEKLDHLPEMEKLLRQVIALKPDHPHAHNALGYSLADRGQRLPEARDLIRRALELSPGDPFITDSLGWVEFRLGNRDESLRLLRQAYAARPDTEIAAHLGEVLWAAGQQDEARRIWREARGRDAANDVLRETLGRLKVAL
jgi:tetratricopeptide (TPR) repeat protein